jgi:hypothetical protein
LEGVITQKGACPKFQLLFTVAVEMRITSARFLKPKDLTMFANLRSPPVLTPADGPMPEPLRRREVVRFCASSIGANERVSQALGFGSTPAGNRPLSDKRQRHEESLIHNNGLPD